MGQQSQVSKHGPASYKYGDIPPWHATIIFAALSDCRIILDLPYSPLLGDTSATPRTPLAPES